MLISDIKTHGPLKPAVVINCHNDAGKYQITVDVELLSALARRAAANKSRKSVEAGGALVIKAVS